MQTAIVANVVISRLRILSSVDAARFEKGVSIAKRLLSLSLSLFRFFFLGEKVGGREEVGRDRSGKIRGEVPQGTLSMPTPPRNPLENSNILRASISISSLARIDIWRVAFVARSWV